MDYHQRTTAEQTSRRALFFISIGILVVSLVFSGYYIGYKRGLVSGTDITITGVVNAKENADFNLFWEAWQTLRENHIDADAVTNEDLLYGAIGGVAGSFDDPHTSFFPPAEAEKFEQDVAGNFGGIGAEIGLNKEGLLSIIAPLKESPAERIGLFAGDLIVKIDDEVTTDMSVDEAVSHIRGMVGTPVVLHIYREGWLQPKDIQIVRETIKVPTLDIALLDEGRVAHIQLYSFNENALPVFVKAAQEVMSSGAKGIILDMRNNPGGYLDVAVRIAGLFLDNDEVVVSEQFKDGSLEPLYSEGSGALKHLPAVVLINGGSASASEILAGALRDVRGVKLVGEKSFGKGTVQELMGLSNGSSLKVTIARWVMPAGQILDEVGLEPDYVVEFTEEDIETENDPQLDKALEVLQAQM